MAERGAERPEPMYALKSNRSTRIEDAASALIDNLIASGVSPDQMGPLTRELWEALKS